MQKEKTLLEGDKLRRTIRNQKKGKRVTQFLVIRSEPNEMT